MLILNVTHFFLHFCHNFLNRVSSRQKPTILIFIKSILLTVPFVALSYCPLYALEGNVYVLDGPSLYSSDANINGLSVDLSSADSIHSSIASIAPHPINISYTSPSGDFDAEVTLNTHKTRPIHPFYFGFNEGLAQLRRLTKNWLSDGTFAHEDPRFQALVGKFRPGLLRLMGGNERVYWTRDNSLTEPPDGWGKGTYPHLLRAKDVDIFYQMCQEIGCELYPRAAHATLNSADLDMWVDFLQYIEEKDYDIKYMCMGNEPTLGIPETLTGTECANRFKQHYDAFRKIKSDLIFGAAETMRPRSCNWREPWNPFYVDFMNSVKLSYQLGIVSSHYYQSDNPTVKSLLAWTSGEPEHYHPQYWTNATRSLASLRDKYYPNALIAWTEFGPGGNSQETHKSVGTALWAADVLGRAARAGADAMLYYYLTVSEGVSMNVYPAQLFINDFSKIFPIAYTYIMFGQWWGDDWVLDVNSTDEGKLSVNGSVSDDGKIYVMLINKTENQDLKTHVSVQTTYGNSYFTWTAKAHSITLVSFKSEKKAELPSPINLKVIKTTSF